MVLKTHLKTDCYTFCYSILDCFPGSLKPLLPLSCHISDVSMSKDQTRITVRSLWGSKFASAAMRDVSGYRPVYFNRLLIDGEELPGQPPEDASTNEEARRNADTHVRQLIVEERRQANPAVLQELEPAEDTKGTTMVDKLRAGGRADERSTPEKSVWTKLSKLRWGRPE